MMNRKNQLFTSSLLFILLLVVWPVFMALAQPPEELNEKLSWILNNQCMFKLQFFFAFLISPSLIFMMVSQLNLSERNLGKTNTIGFIFLGAYLVLCSISYGAQFVIVPQLIEQKMIQLAQVVYFDSETSFTYFLNQTGYFFWALGSLTLFFKFMFKNGALKAISFIYVFSAILSIIAFVGLIVKNEILNSMTFLSGISLLPAGIISIFQGWKIVKTN